MRQVFVVERTRCELDGTHISTELAYGLTSLSEAAASPKRLLELNRGHWEIENRLHWVRDVTFDEDRSQVRKGRGAHAMATLRNLSISLLRMAGAKNIASATRFCGRKAGRSLRLIGVR